MNARKFLQWAVLSALCFVGIVAFMVVAGDDDPNNPLPIGTWLLVKGVAMAVIALCVLTGKVLHRHGLLPDAIDKFNDEEV